VVLKGRGKMLPAPPDLGGLNKHKLIAAFGGTEGLKAGKSSGEGGPLGKDGVMVRSCLGAEDGAQKGGSREAKGEEEEAEDVLIGEMGGKTIKADTNGGAMERMVEGDMGGLELIGNSGEGGGESREEGRFEIGLAGAKDKTQVGAEPLTER
jgi:hypothetical protein